MLPREDALEPMQRQMIDVLGDDHVRQEPGARQRLLHGLRRRRRFDDAFMALRTGIFRADRFDHHEAGRFVLEFLRDVLPDACPHLAARAPFVPRRQYRFPPVVAAGAPATAAGPSGADACGRAPASRPNPFRPARRLLPLVGELLQREFQLSGIDALRFLAEQPLAQDIELVAQRGDFALRLGELILERGDERPRRRQVLDGGVEGPRRIHYCTLRRSGVSRLHPIPQRWGSRDPLIPAAPPRLGQIDPGQQQHEITAPHGDRLTECSWKPVRNAAVGGPNQVVSASAIPSWVRSPTQATYPSGLINTRTLRSLPRPLCTDNVFVPTPLGQ